MADVRVLAGRYELGELLGRGGMGEVWAAWDSVVRRQVAVKLLKRGGGSADEERRLLREAHTAGGLNHPGVVTVHDLGQDEDGTPYLVMELLAGHDLSRVLRQDGPPTVERAVDLAAATAAALAVAHDAGIVHRDLKPGNLMLTPDGTVKILDFGLARFATTATTASQAIGTPAYMPPERLLGRPGDARGDLYALGCVLHELLTGDSPFGNLEPAAAMFAHVHTEPNPPSTKRVDVPAALDALVLDLLAKSPDDRPATAHEVHERLRALTLTPHDSVPPT
ncbi:serine/threonine-protein kinase, partial [Streptomyces boluensis]